MTLFDKLLEEIKPKGIDEEVKAICDTIAKEEEHKMGHSSEAPVGPNIFLSLEVPSINKKEDNLTYMCLEREAPMKYIVSVWEKKKGVIKRIKTTECDFNETKKIMRFYAEQVKFMRGG